MYAGGDDREDGEKEQQALWGRWKGGHSGRDEGKQVVEGEEGKRVSGRAGGSMPDAMTSCLDLI